MSGIPKSARDFSSPTFWKKFFQTHDSPFEWYGNYSQLSPILEKYLKPSDQILQIGCGNSLLAEQLYDNGFRNVKSIDTDLKVIKRQKDNNYTKRPELKFECQSAEKLDVFDSSINAIIDKGTIDALLPPNSSEEKKKLVKNILYELDRCLTSLGRLIIITLGQWHIIEFILDFFLPLKKYFIRIQKCELLDDAFVMPVFALIITKLKLSLPNIPCIEYVRQMSISQEKTSDYKKIMKFIELEQELNWFKHYVNKNIINEAAIKLCSDDDRLRYELIVVDDTRLKVLQTMAAFVVPFGREADWLFSTPKGRKALRQECGKHRLIIIRLFRDQNYQSMENIKKELTQMIIKLRPYSCNETKIDFMSLGSVDLKNTIATGNSVKNGAWGVEEIIKNNDEVYRRLVFFSNSGVVQSEVQMLGLQITLQFFCFCTIVKDLGKTKKNKPKFQTNHLACSHHRSMLVAINVLLNENAIVDGAIKIEKVKTLEIKMAVLGLGGGLFPKFLYENFLKAKVVAVEFDSEILTIAQKYFGLPELNDRFQVIIDDALNFITDISTKDEKEKFDILFVDLAGANNEDGLACPPAAFVTENAIKMMKNCLQKNGILAFNLVTRDQDKLKEVKYTISGIFDNFLLLNDAEEVNEVLICYCKNALNNNF